MANILFLEPFYSGSHKYFADGLVKHSRHQFTLLTLPGRHWKWRMESSALELAEQNKGNMVPHIVMATNLIDLPQWKEFSGLREVPHILYVHENQLDYPLNQGEKRDFHYGWKDYVNFLTADRIIFNSRYNLDSFCRGLIELSPALPGFKPEFSLKRIRDKTLIIPPGCTLPSPENSLETGLQKAYPPVFLWNHRWEHDKNPETFFRLLRKIKGSGRKFKLILLGQSYRNSPLCFMDAGKEFNDEIIQLGYSESRETYENWLRRSDFVFSTAHQENFGISMVEAISAGALPLLPDRLAYPEVIPEEFHKLFLYRSEEDLFNKTVELMDSEDRDQIRKTLRKSMVKYSWEKQIKRFDSTLESMT